MLKVSGIGGLFFRARDSDAIALWYRDNLGIDPVPTAYAEPSWTQQAGETVFTAMPGVVDQFGLPDRITDTEGNPIQLWEPAG